MELSAHSFLCNLRSLSNNYSLPTEIELYRRGITLKKQLSDEILINYGSFEEEETPRKIIRIKEETLKSFAKLNNVGISEMMTVQIFNESVRFIFELGCSIASDNKLGTLIITIPEEDQK